MCASDLFDVFKCLADQTRLDLQRLRVEQEIPAPPPRKPPPLRNSTIAPWVLAARQQDVIQAEEEEAREDDFIGSDEGTPRSQVHAGFGQALVDWLGSLRWFPATQGGWSNVSALELLWQFTFDTGRLPPFWFEGRWTVADEAVFDGFGLPRMQALCRSWVKALRAVEGLPEFCIGADGLSALGATFNGLALPGRVPLHPVVVADLLSLFGRRSTLAALRFPAFW
eukprot:s1025_g16.t2